MLRAAGFLGQPVVPAAAAPPASLVGRQVGHYRVEALLGEGGMSSVYLAVRADDVYQQRVAVKVLGYGADRADLAARFDLTAFRNTPVKQRVVPRDASAARRWLHMLEEGRESPDHFPLIQRVCNTNELFV